MDKATAGYHDPGTRSDCLVELSMNSKKGLSIEINSKVASLYGQSIKNLAKEILTFFNIHVATLVINDAGALPFVIAARVEAAIKQLLDTNDEFLPEFLEENRYETSRERFRFSRLYLPGNTPKMMLNAGIHHPDGIILDLEDSVAPPRKHEARFLVRNALRQVNFYGAERMVRINQIPAGLNDLQFVVPHNVHVILIPKCESAEQVKLVDQSILKIREEKNVTGEVFYMPIIESALGVENAYKIATASDNVVALTLGLEDLTADLGVQRTMEGNETLYARTRVVNACKAARVQAIDSVFSDVDDPEGLLKTGKVSKSLGFEGMGCIHPGQISVIRNAFAPKPDEIEKAEKIVAAWETAQKEGKGVVSLGSKMIDPPVVKRALQTIKLKQQITTNNNK